jgi:hypothetical protein
LRDVGIGDVPHGLGTKGNNGSKKSSRVCSPKSPPKESLIKKLKELKNLLED